MVYKKLKLYALFVWASCSGIARGGGGDKGGPPRASLLGGGKIDVIPKNLEREKVF